MTPPHTELPCIIPRGLILGVAWEKGAVNHNKRYADYLACLLSDDEETPDADAQWIEGCTDAFVKAKMKLHEYENSEEVNKTMNSLKLTAASADPAQPAVKDEVKRAKRAVKFERSTLNSRIQSLDSAVLEETAAASLIEETPADMKRQLEKYLSVQKELIVQLSDEEEAGNELSITEKIQTMCIGASVKASKVIQEKTSIICDNKIKTQSWRSRTET